MSQNAAEEDESCKNEHTTEEESAFHVGAHLSGCGHRGVRKMTTCDECSGTWPQCPVRG